MQHLRVYLLISALALAAFSEGSRKSPFLAHHQPSGPGANRGLEPLWLDQLGPAPRHQRQLWPEGPSHHVGDLSKKQGPWMEEEEAYGWMDFGRRSAEEGDQQP
ncbi:gastrin [Echinops telfairi]|uniref:Gastrin n=1 Tax=Echinops telfairi TaxID=9371 RepID=A0ABM0ITB7_ECHTE|nr:gastrin [Echinops telfairi]